MVYTQLIRLSLLSLSLILLSACQGSDITLSVHDSPDEEQTLAAVDIQDLGPTPGVIIDIQRDNRIPFVPAPTFESCNDKIAIRNITLNAVNEVRRSGYQCGDDVFEPTHALTWNLQLEQASIRHSLDMAENLNMSHEGSDGSRVYERIERTGYSAGTWGENISRRRDNPEHAISSWLASPSHCRNIMQADFTEIAVSCALGSNGQLYWTMVLSAQATQAAPQAAPRATP